MVEMSQIEALSQQIAEQFHPERIILFGSYAYGEPNEDSDVDLLVVMPFDPTFRPLKCHIWDQS